MILFIYLLGVLVSVYLTLVECIRSNARISKDWTDTFGSSDITLISFIGLLSWVGAVCSLVVILIDSDTHFNIGSKLKKFIEKITFTK